MVLAPKISSQCLDRRVSCPSGFLLHLLLTPHRPVSKQWHVIVRWNSSRHVILAVGSLIIAKTISKWRVPRTAASPCTLT